MSSQLRFAIIGCGKIAPRHAREIVRKGELAAVCDIVKEKADQLAKEFSSQPYDSLDDLLANETNIDCIVICTPNGLHASQAIQVLKAGIHVLCEKPMAIAYDQTQHMIDAAESAKRRLLVVKQNRFNPPVAYIRQLLEQQKLGKILSFQLNCFWNRPAAYFSDSWRGTMALDGGTLFTQFSHFIDILYYLLGEVKIAQGLRHNYEHRGIIEFEDTGVAILEMKSGAIGSFNYTLNAHQHNMEGSLTLFGERGTVKIGGQYLNHLEYFSVADETAPVLPTGSANQYGFYEGSMSNHDKVYDELVKALADPAYTFIDPRETQQTVKIIEMIYKRSPLLP